MALIAGVIVVVLYSDYVIKWLSFLFSPSAPPLSPSSHTHAQISLSGSFVPDLIVSMTHQMWLHLQSDESVGSIGFKINYKGERK